jgi:hypothetical protein
VRFQFFHQGLEAGNIFIQLRRQLKPRHLCGGLGLFAVGYPILYIDIVGRIQHRMSLSRY